MIEVDIAYQIIHSKFHRQFDLVKPLVSVGQDAREIVERSEPDISSGADEDAVVFRMTVGPGDEPIEGERVNEGLHIGCRSARVVSEQADNVAGTGTSIVLLFLGRGESERLAHELGVSYSYLSKLENEEIGPSEELIERIAEHFEYDRAKLMLSAGKVPEEIVQILQSHPDEAIRMLRERFADRTKR
jgi:transcriptional regulator with XRE-family HTH domain